MTRTSFMSQASADAIDHAIRRRSSFQVESCTLFNEEDGEPYVISKIFQCVDTEYGKWEMLRYVSDDSDGMVGVSEDVIDEEDINYYLDKFYTELEEVKGLTIENLAAVGYAPVHLCKVVEYCDDGFAIPNHETLEVEIQPHDPTDEAVSAAFND